jgi:stress-induced morphogen
MLDAQALRRRILEAFPDAEVEFIDMTGTGDHFEARVVTAAFAGKSMVQQHRMIYGLFGEELKSGALHALKLSTYTPEAWNKK